MSKPSLPFTMTKLNADRIVSWSAIFVSLSTLFVIIYQTNLMRTEQKAAVFPYLTIGFRINNEGQALYVTNSGLGPAIIKSVRVTDSLGTVEGGVIPYIEKRLGPRTKDFEDSSMDLLIPGRLIPDEQKLRVFKHSHEGPLGSYLGDTFRFAFSEAGHAVIEIEYESVYGERWLVRSDKYTPQALE